MKINVFFTYHYYNNQKENLLKIDQADELKELQFGTKVIFLG